VDQGSHAGAVVWLAALVLRVVARLLQAGDLVIIDHLLMAEDPQQEAQPCPPGRARDAV
jgi:hypothetical protein